MLKFLNQINLDRRNKSYHSLQDDGTDKLISKVRVEFEYNDMKFSRTFSASQSYTWVGKVVASIKDADASYDGLNKNYLSLSQAISTEIVLLELSKQTQLTADMVAYYSNVHKWDWYDNHVTLLVNLLRFYILSDINYRTKLSVGKYPVYDDGHVIIDLTLKLSFREKEVNWSWPGKRNIQCYPHWIQLKEFLPLGSDPHIDLRPLTEEEASIVLMMTGEWELQTNFKLDFHLPKLADKIIYRYQVPITPLNDRLTPRKSECSFCPPHPDVIWSALRKYTTHNNLYNQFYTANNIIAQVMLTVYPDTAEGMTWLTHVPEVRLPKFGSVRGRYPFLISGAPAFIQEQALDDWMAVDREPELLFTYGMTLASTLNIGLALRDNEILHLTGIKSNTKNASFLNPETFFASAVSLATGIDTPLNGMRGVYVYYPTLIETKQTWKVPAVILESSGYLVQNNHILSKGIPFVGSPYLVHPLDLFEESNPYCGNFVLLPSSRCTRKGAIYSFMDAWKIGWATRIAGYDLSINVLGSEVNYQKFFSPNGNSWCPFLTNGINDNVGDVLIKNMNKRAKHFVDLPNFVIPGNQVPIVVCVKVLNSYIMNTSLNHKKPEFKKMAKSTYKRAMHSSLLSLTRPNYVSRDCWGCIQRQKHGLILS